MALMFPTVMLVLNVSSVAVLWFGAHRVDAGAMQVGALTAFLSYLIQILMSVMMATFMVMHGAARRGLRRADQRGARHRVLGRPPATPSRTFAGTGELELRRRVDFSTPGRRARCCGTSRFTASPGQTTAIIGSTGAGKTTLLSLIPRLFDATGGAVLRRRRRRPRPRPRGAVGADRAGAAAAVPVHRHGRQQPALRQPGRHRRGAVGSAGDRPGARTSSRRCRGGLDAPIAQGGTNVSGGQRQRLAIARALVRKPEIYLFDDSFSALDLATDARLRAALRAGDRARPRVVIVAQRVSTIIDADQIIVLEDGAIVGTRHATTSCSRPARRTPRSSSPSWPRRRPHDATAKLDARRPGEDQPAETVKATDAPRPPDARSALGQRRHAGREVDELRPVGQAAARPAAAAPGHA